MGGKFGGRGLGYSRRHQFETTMFKAKALREWQALGGGQVFLVLFECCAILLVAMTGRAN